MNDEQLKSIIEAILLAYGQPITIEKIQFLFEEYERPTTEQVRTVLQLISEEYTNRPMELKEIASGFSLQVKADYGRWLAKLWEERPPRYSRALLETLALIAYRQPITRGEVEDIRGVVVSTHIIKTLMEREWIRVVGHREVPGKPALYATTRTFLDYFNLKNLDELPTLAELQDIDSVEAQLTELQEEMTEEKESVEKESVELHELVEA